MAIHDELYLWHLLRIRLGRTVFFCFCDDHLLPGNSLESLLNLKIVWKPFYTYPPMSPVLHRNSSSEAPKCNRAEEVRPMPLPRASPATASCKPGSLVSKCILLNNTGLHKEDQDGQDHGITDWLPLLKCYGMTGSESRLKLAFLARPAVKCISL